MVATKREVIELAGAFVLEEAVGRALAGPGLRPAAVAPAILPALLVTLVISAATAQRVEPLVLADLRVSGVAVDDDSASVRQRLGTPVRVDANVLHYPDLDVVLKDDKVAILSITGPSRATRRGLQVGAAVEVAARLYRPCHADSTLVQICYNAPRFAERVVLVAVADGRVSRIDIGRIVHAP